ncbi:hypothetical protein [Nannocystis bainbridge]|uniref:Uncharacterized protein n=1 Tax=Nannocystis bainbridge TaxID=2995303 RepID=A0ABT5EFK5_9BACT|nr:hypothetical protein [Nannocystis bainbridge]MDC0723631.1 hypothetical protein [Nannocystis bainbridge]
MQQGDGSTIVVSLAEPGLVVSVVSVVVVVVVVVSAVVVVVVGTVVVGSPVVVPGSVVDVEVPGSVAADSDEPSDAPVLPVDCVASSEQAENSGENATSARVSEAKLRKRRLLNAEDGAAAVAPQHRSAQGNTMVTYTRGPPRILRFSNPPCIRPRCPTKSRSQQCEIALGLDPP